MNEALATKQITEEAMRLLETEQQVNCFLARKPTRLAPIAMANKTARIIWAVLTRQELYQAPQFVAA